MTDFSRPNYWYPFVIALGVIFGLLQLQQSLRQGLLALPPTYDNNGYLIEAIGYVKPLLDDGPRAFVAKLFRHPPHAPIATALAICGFLLFGVRDWSPNLVQALEPVLLLLLVDRIGRNSPLIVRLAVMVAALCVPVNGFLVQEDRPDVFWGMLLAGGITLAIGGTKDDRPTALLAGSLMGLAVLAKPTAFPVTVIMIFAAVLLAVLKTRMVASVGDTKRYLARLILPACLVPLPYFLFGWRQIADYFIQVVLSPQADNWLLMQPGPLSTELQYYSIGPGGQQMLQYAPHFFVAIVIAALLCAMRRKDRSFLVAIGCFLSIVVLSYALISFPKLKSAFFGCGFYYLIILGAAQAIFYVEASIDQGRLRRAGGVLAIVVAGLSLSAFKFPALSGALLSGKSVQEAAREWPRTLETIISKTGGCGSRNNVIYVTTPYLFINEHTLNYINRRDGGLCGNYISLYRSNSLPDYLDSLGRADAVVALDPAVVGSELVPANIQSELIQRVTNESEFQSAGEVTFAGASVGRIYVRKPSFSGFSVLSGLSIGERPPISAGAVVRWGTGPATELKIRFPTSGRLVLNVNATTPLPNMQEVVISLDGQIQSRLQFKNGAADASIELKAAPGEAVLTLSYPSWMQGTFADARKLAVLFRKLQFLDVQ